MELPVSHGHRIRPAGASALRQRSAHHRRARRAAGRRPRRLRPDRFRRQRHRRPPQHRHAGGGVDRHRAVLAADDDSDGHADVVAAGGVAARRRRAPARSRRAVPPGPVAGGHAGCGAVRLAHAVGAAAGTDGHRGGNPPGCDRVPAWDPLGRAGVHPVPHHALSQRRPALDLADHAAGLRRPAGAGAARLRADLRPRRFARDGCGRPRRRFGHHDVGAGARLRVLPVARQALRRSGAVRSFRSSARSDHPRPVAHRSADRRDRDDGRRACSSPPRC